MALPRRGAGVADCGPEELTLHLGQAGAVAEDEDDPDETLVGPHLGLALQLLQQARLLLRQAARNEARVQGSDRPRVRLEDIQHPSALGLRAA